MQKGVSYNGFVVSSFANIASATACQNLCQQDVNCNFFEWSPTPTQGTTCWLKWKLTGGKSVQTDHWSGPRFCCKLLFLFCAIWVFTVFISF